MPIQQLPEVRLAQPPVDALTHFDAHDRGHGGGAAQPSCEIDLAESACAEQPLDPVLQVRFGAGHDLAGHEQPSCLA